MRYFLILFLAACFISQADAQVYDVVQIPDSLKEGVAYIVWQDYREFRVLNEGEAVEHVKFAVLVTNKFSNRYNDFPIRYSNDLILKDLSAVLYNAAGDRIKKLKGSDITDVTAISGVSMYEDNRMKVLHCVNNTYPYTIEIEYTRTIKGLLNYPSWSFMSGTKTGVISSKLDFIIPLNMKFRHIEFNLSNPVKVTEKEGNTIYTWEENNLKAIENEDMMPPSWYYLPMVRLAPVKFRVGDYEGTMENWSGLGNWDYRLNANRDKLPDETVAKISSLVKNTQNDREKVKKLYEFMQDHTRYVSVQLGIGGWQTFPADYVDKNGYGDCKALTNYMHSLLKYAGISSFAALVNAGKNKSDILTDFPSNQFNHVILCVPMAEDSIWLECTSQKQPFDFLGSFTDNRSVLLIKENDSHLTKTPEYTNAVNTIERKTEISLQSGGEADISMTTAFTGLSFENRFGIENYSLNDKKKILHDIYTLSGMTLTSIKYNTEKKEVPVITEDIDMKVTRLASVSNKRIFMKLNLFSKIAVPAKNSERILPFQIKRGYTKIDSVTVTIPEGYKIENLPSSKNIESKFFSFKTETSSEGRNVIFVRTLITNPGLFPASDYQEYYDLMKKVKRYDNAKLVLVRE